MDGNPREAPEFHRNLLCGNQWFNPNGRWVTLQNRWKPALPTSVSSLQEKFGLCTTAEYFGL